MSLGALAFGDVVGAPPRALGDVVCTVIERNDAESAVAQMNAVFASNGNPPQWSNAVAAVNASWQQYVQHESGLPNVFAYCQAKDVGAAAMTVTQQMAASSGKQAPPTLPGLTPGPSTGFGQIAGAVSTAAVVGVLVWGGMKLVDELEKRRKPDRSGE